jgi:ABC-type transporter MlaC component
MGCCENYWFAGLFWMRNFRVFQSLLILSAFVSLSSFAADSLFVGLARQFMKDLVEVSQDSKELGTLPNDSAKQKIKKVSDQIHFLSLAQMSFGKKWSGFSSQDKKDFLAVLQDLLETVAYPKAKKFSASLDEMLFVETKPGQVMVSGRIEREKRGERVSEKFQILLIYSKNLKKITDAVIDAEKISSNLGRQFAEALKKKSFRAIIEQMRKRVANAKSS